jgi:AbiJ N-terminal domain 4
MRTIVCEVLRTPPNRDNWSDGNVYEEVEALLARCPWYRVYDIIEAFHRFFVEGPHSFGETAAAEFEQYMNEFFLEEGIGWKLADGRIVNRGSEEFEIGVETATAALEEAHCQTAGRELHQAIANLSRRPEPDLTGAIQHAMAAMECVAREYCDDPQPTFGKLMERNPDMLPRPLDQAVEKAWGYASEMGRHIREGRVPEREEAELIVGIAATISTYLIRKKARQ